MFHGYIKNGYIIEKLGNKPLEIRIWLAEYQGSLLENILFGADIGALVLEAGSAGGGNSAKLAPCRAVEPP